MTRQYVWHIFPSRSVEWTAERLRSQLIFAQKRDPRILTWAVSNLTMNLDDAAQEVRELFEDRAPILAHMEVIGRDWHEVGEIAQGVIAAVCVSTKSRAMPISLRKPPHTNRGYAAGRTKTTRTQGERHGGSGNSAGVQRRTEDS